MTLNWPNNVDEQQHLKDLIDEIVQSSNGLPVIFPVHPRTAKMLESLNIRYENLKMVEPLGYLEFIYLIKNSKAIVTDSGGITEEATVLGIPCMTLRDSTERPETVSMGTNELIGTDPTAVKPAFEKLFNGQWKRGDIPDLWDGNTAQRIVKHIETII